MGMSHTQKMESANKNCNQCISNDNRKTSVHWYKPKQFIRKHQSEHIPPEFSAVIESSFTEEWKLTTVRARQMIRSATPDPENTFEKYFLEQKHTHACCGLRRLRGCAVNGWEAGRERVQWGPEPSASARINKTTHSHEPFTKTSSAFSSPPPPLSPSLFRRPASRSLWTPESVKGEGCVSCDLKWMTRILHQDNSKQMNTLKKIINQMYYLQGLVSPDHSQLDVLAPRLHNLSSTDHIQLPQQTCYILSASWYESLFGTHVTMVMWCLPLVRLWWPVWWRRYHSRWLRLCSSSPKTPSPSSRCAQ